MASTYLAQWSITIGLPNMVAFPLLEAFEEQSVIFGLDPPASCCRGSLEVLTVLKRPFRHLILHLIGQSFHSVTVCPPFPVCPESFVFL